MKFFDLLRTAFMNLWRRKLRAFLTVLGMVIGVASIVVMVSLGLGIRQATIESFAGTGSLTTIQVNNYRTTESANGTAYVTESASVKLDKRAVDSFKKLAHVEAVMPVLQCWGGYLKSGRYVTDANMIGVDLDAAAKFDIVPAQGELPGRGNASTMEMVLGSWTLENFYNPQDYQPAYDRDGNPRVTLDSRIQFTFDSSNIYGGEAYDQATGAAISHGTFYKVRATGVMGADNNNFGWYCIMDMDALKKLMKDNKAYVSQSTNDYSEIYVKCDDLDNMDALCSAIEEMGYGTYSTRDAVKMAQESTQRIQYLLGAIGGVALLVAAIGIMNTMMMSIYERTKEIGIIKVLGCRMINIAELFLTEAAFIGLFGGALGLGVSYGIGALLTAVLAESGLRSIIPAYLALGALAFSVVVAVISGLYPALRAMRLSPLNAIRNE